MTLCRLLGAGRLPLALSRWDPGRSECRASATSPVGVPARLGSSDARFAHVPGLPDAIYLVSPYLVLGGLANTTGSSQRQEPWHPLPRTRGTGSL